MGSGLGKRCVYLFDMFLAQMLRYHAVLHRDDRNHIFLPAKYNVHRAVRQKILPFSDSKMSF